MPMTTPVVELGFDLTESLNPPFFTLNDSVKGRLDNEEYTLGGSAFVDVTSRVRSFDFGRGRAQTFPTFPAGSIDIELNNHDRAFDPLFQESPFRGNIIPQRQVRIKVNDIIVYTGLIDDWDLSYTNDGDSTAMIKASEGIANLNRRFLPGSTPPEESAADRINRVLDEASVNWPDSLREIDSDTQLMASNPIPDETSALEYLQNISLSEPGDLFLTRDGNLKFRGRRPVPDSTDVIEFGSAGVPFDNVRVVYGSELLFNSVRLTREGGGTVVATDQESIAEYGVNEFNVEDMQLATDEQMIDVAVRYVSSYSEPEYRFEAFDVYLHKFDKATQDRLLAADIGTPVKVAFTPNKIGAEIVRYGEIIRIDHVVLPDSHTVTFGLSEVFYRPFVLDDDVFGRLDFGRLSW